MNKVMISAICMLSLYACTVKEDRQSCPCSLNLDFSEIDTTSVSALLLCISDASEYAFSESLSADTFFPEYKVFVPRKHLYVNVFHGVDESFCGSGGLFIPYGSECPEVYMCSLPADAEKEEADVRIGLHKNYCRIALSIVKEGGFEYSISVKGTVNGYGADGSPSRGDFSYTPESEGAVYSLAVPRQLDSSLILEIDDGTDVLKSFALGEYISASGYDWSAQDLEDISVQIDWTLTDMTLTIQGWDWSHEFEIII